VDVASKVAVWSRDFEGIVLTETERSEPSMGLSLYRSSEPAAFHSATSPVRPARLPLTHSFALSTSAHWKARPTAAQIPSEDCLSLDVCKLAGMSPRRRQRRLRGRAPRRHHWLSPGPALLRRRNTESCSPSPPTRSSGRSKRQDRPLAALVVRKRPTLASSRPTPPGSPNLLQVSLNKEVDRRAQRRSFRSTSLRLRTRSLDRSDCYRTN
jgi:hypothetical protein